MMINTIFFDQDNTLFNTRQHSAAAYRHALNFLASKHQLNSEQLFRDWRDIVKKSQRSQDSQLRSFSYSIAVLLKQYSLDLDDVEEVNHQLLTYIRDQIETTGGTLEFFDLKLAISKVLFTEDNSVQSQVKLQAWNLEGHFDLVITSDLIGVMKPHLDYLTYGWKRLDVKPTHCLYIGDSWEKDCSLGQEHGGIGVLFGSYDHRADYCINSMMELVEILERHGGIV